MDHGHALLNAIHIMNLVGMIVKTPASCKCGVETTVLDDPCDGQCPMGRTKIQGKLIFNTWDCEGRIHLAEEPCLQKCPET